MPLSPLCARSRIALVELAASNASDGRVLEVRFARDVVVFLTEAGPKVANETIWTARSSRIQCRGATPGTVHAAGCSATAERCTGRAVPTQVRAVAAVSTVRRANATGATGGVAATNHGAAFARPVGIAFRVVAQAAVVATPVVAIRMLPPEPPGLVGSDSPCLAVLLVVVGAITELPAPPVPASPIAVVVIVIVVVACLRFVLGQRKTEDPGRRTNDSNPEGVPARRCLRQRSGEEIEPSFIHLRHSSWRLEPLPPIIAGTLLAYAFSTTRKRETGTSGFTNALCVRSVRGSFQATRYEISKMVSISTGTLPGSACSPTAERACTPRSPNTSWMNSEKP